MPANLDLLAYCGIYCGACSSRLAFDNQDQVYAPGVSAEQHSSTDAPVRLCPGCRRGDTSGRCAIRECAQERALVHCGACADFPCSRITKFNGDGTPHHGESMANLKHLRDVGEAAWLEEQRQLWTCACGARRSLYLGKCPTCGETPLRGVGGCAPGCKPDDIGFWAQFGLHVRGPANRVDLPRLVSSLARVLLEAADCPGHYEILKRTFGLDGSRQYTLSEIARTEGLSRERVRQKEKAAIKRVRKALLGQPRPRRLALPQCVVDQASTVLAALKARGPLVTEPQALEVIAEVTEVRRDQPASNEIKFLFEVLGLRPLRQRSAGGSRTALPAWVTEDGFDAKELESCVEGIRRYLMHQDGPVDSFHLAVQLSRDLGRKVAEETIRLAARICGEIEELSAGVYQVRFEHLPSLASKAHRALHETGSPMHYRELARLIKKRLADAGHARQCGVPPSLRLRAS